MIAFPPHNSKRYIGGRQSAYWKIQTATEEFAAVENVGRPRLFVLGSQTEDKPSQNTYRFHAQSSLVKHYLLTRGLTNQTIRWKLSRSRNPFPTPAKVGLSLNQVEMQSVQMIVTRGQICLSLITRCGNAIWKYVLVILLTMRHF